MQPVIIFPQNNHEHLLNVHPIIRHFCFTGCIVATIVMLLSQKKIETNILN